DRAVHAEGAAPVGATGGGVLPRRGGAHAVPGAIRMRNGGRSPGPRANGGTGGARDSPPLVTPDGQDQAGAPAWSWLRYGQPPGARSVPGRVALTRLLRRALQRITE